MGLQKFCGVVLCLGGLVLSLPALGEETAAGFAIPGDSSTEAASCECPDPTRLQCCTHNSQVELNQNDRDQKRVSALLGTGGEKQPIGTPEGTK